MKLSTGKKITLGLAAVLSISLFAGCSKAANSASNATDGKAIKFGHLTFQNDKGKEMAGLRRELATLILDNDYIIEGQEGYDNLVSMQMALDSGKIDLLVCPDFVGDYLVKTNNKYKIAGTTLNSLTFYSMGFAESNTALRDKVNTALADLEKDGIIMDLTYRYILKQNPETASVAFENFDGADTITVAVTGDMPPMDYIGADGKASGFNTALLSEVAKKLKVNVKIMNIESAARSSAIASGKADVVFWYESPRGERAMNANSTSSFEIPAEIKDFIDRKNKTLSIDGVIFSNSYFQSPNKYWIAVK